MNAFIADVEAQIINGTQAYFEIALQDGRKFGLDVNLYPADDRKTGFHSRFNVDTDCVVLAEAHHFENVDATLQPWPVKNQEQQVRYVHGALMPEPPAFLSTGGAR